MARWNVKRSATNINTDTLTYKNREETATAFTVYLVATSEYGDVFNASQTETFINWIRNMHHKTWHRLRRDLVQVYNAHVQPY